MAPRTMSAEDYVIDDQNHDLHPQAPVSAYTAAAQRASGGARQGAGAAPYPLYGIGQTSTAAAEVTPFYRTMWFGVVVGAGGIGALWAYLGWWKPRQSKMKKKSEKNKGKRRLALKAGNED